MKNREKAVLNFMYFLRDHKDGWLKECFKDEPPYILNELKEKYDRLRIRKAPCNVVFYFFFTLPINFQVIMMRYVEDNYIAFKEHKIKQT